MALFWFDVPQQKTNEINNFRMRKLVKLYPVDIVKDDTSWTDDEVRDTMASDALKDVEVTLLVMCCCGDGSRLGGIPEDEISIWSHSDSSLESQQEKFWLENSGKFS